MDKNQHRRRRKKAASKYEEKFIFPISFEEAMKRMGEDKREDKPGEEIPEEPKKSDEQDGPKK